MDDFFRIHFDELTPQTREELLKFMDVSDPQELNWDVFPVAFVFRTSDRVDAVKREKSSHDLPRNGYIWDLDDEYLSDYTLDLDEG